MITTNQQHDLKALLGPHITFDASERWYYSRDLLRLPAWVTSLVRAMPDAVAAPRSTAEISSILAYCLSNAIPVTCRGAGTSGTFAAVPKRGGLVLDMRGLAADAVVDASRKMVSVDAGMSWWELDRQLRRQGLTLKAYPSSAIASTVGGWIMTSGLGIGSLQFGRLEDHLLAADLVLANGSVRSVVGGGELDSLAGSEGMLGVVTRASIEVRPVPASVRTLLFAFEKTGNAFEFIVAVAESGIPAYAVELFDRPYLEMVEQSSISRAKSRPAALVLVRLEGDEEQVHEAAAAVERLGQRHAAEQAPGGDEEWGRRFNTLRVRRALPYLVPSNVHLPVNALARFYDRVKKLRRYRGLVGHLVSREECVLMPMFAASADEGADYVLALRAPLEVSGIAVSLGGKPGGGVGLWNSYFRGVPRLKQKTEQVRTSKMEFDPAGILNPGNWLDTPPLFRPAPVRAALAAAAVLDLMTPVPNLRVAVGELDACVQCGNCVGYCPTRQDWVSSTPRGRVLGGRELVLPSLQRRTAPEEDAVKTLFSCTLCGRCSVDCSVDIKSPEVWTELRCRVSAAGLAPENLRKLSETVEASHNLVGKPNEQRARWADSLKLANRRDRAKTVYFVGCAASFYPMVHDSARSFAQLLDRRGAPFTILGGEEWCCGYPLLSGGYRDMAVAHMEHNISRVAAMQAESLVVTCPGCYRMWKQEYPRLTGKTPDFQVLHSTQLIAREIEQGRLSFGRMEMKVTYHDPCDLGRNGGIYEEPRLIIRSIPGLSFTELESNRQYCNCCGSGGDLLALDQGLSLAIASRKTDEILRTGAEAVVTACPSCIRALTMVKLGRKAAFSVLDVSQLAWRAVAK